MIPSDNEEQNSDVCVQYLAFIGHVNGDVGKLKDLCLT